MRVLKSRSKIAVFVRANLKIILTSLVLGLLVGGIGMADSLPPPPPAPTFEATPARAPSPQSLELYWNGRTAFENDNFIAALGYLAPLRKDPSFLLHDYVLYFIGQSEAELNHDSQALAAYRELLDRHPESFLSMRTRLEMISLLKEMGSGNLARKEGEAILRESTLKEASARTLYYWGQAYQTLGWPREAMNMYVHLLARDPEGAFSKSARDEMKKLRKLFGLRPRALTADELWDRAQFYSDTHDYSKGEDDLKMLVSSYPQSPYAPKALLILADLSYRQKRLANVMRYARQAQAYGGDSYWASLFWMGMAHGGRGDPYSAAPFFSQLIQGNPNHELADDAQFRMGYFYDIGDDLNGARAAYETFFNKFDGKSDVLDQVAWRLGWLHYRQGRFRDARSAFQKAVEKAPHGSITPQCLYWEGKAWEQDRNWAQAKRTYQDLEHFYPVTYFGYEARERLREKYGEGSLKEPLLSESMDAPASAEAMVKFGRLMDMELYEDAIVEARGLTYSSRPSEQRLGKIALSRWYLKQGAVSQSIRVFEKEYAKALEAGTPLQNEKEVLLAVFPLGYAPYVFKAAREFSVDPYLMFALIREESRFKPQAYSYAAAYGLTQIIPSTGRKIAHWMGIRPYRTRRLLEPALNVRMGTYYLALRLSDFKGDKALALAAYNGGAHNVQKWLNEYGYADPDIFREKIPFFQTRHYVKAVLRSYYEYRRIYTQLLQYTSRP